MSADNAIYIRPLKNGSYRVECISSFYPEQLTEEQIDSFFVDSAIFISLDDAWKEEQRIQEEWEKSGHYIEYGSVILYRKD